MTVAAGTPARQAANWILTELLSRVEDPRQVSSVPVKPAALAELLALVESDRVSGKLAKQIWLKMWDSAKSAEQIATEEDLFQQSDACAIEAEVKTVIEANPENVAAYRGGKTKLLGFFIGKAMRAVAGKASAGDVRKALMAGLG